MKLTALDQPNGYTGATPEFAVYTKFNSAGEITGGFGPVSLTDNHSHSTYHGFQVSASNNLTPWGLGVQASYSWSKSLDDVSGAYGVTGAQDPFHTRLERGASSFDVTHAVSFSLFQDLHADRAPVLRYLGARAMGGWQMLAIGSVNTGLPFTVLSGIQQTGVGAGGADRPDQIGKPVFSTGRTVREDYFGLGENNVSYFQIPIGVPGGSGPNEGRFGTLGRSTFRGPMFHNFDLAFYQGHAARHAWRSRARRAAVSRRVLQRLQHCQFRFAAEYAARRGVRSHQQDGGIVPANPVFVEGDLLMGGSARRQVE